MILGKSNQLATAVFIAVIILTGTFHQPECPADPVAGSVGAVNGAAYEDAIKLARTQLWQQIASGKCSSASIAIMVKGEIVYSEGFGASDREKSIPTDTKTIFNIGSVSKIYVTTAIMLLADEGKVLLDNPVTDYLPQFKMADPRYKYITVRMLLNHSSGMPGSEYNNSFGFEYNENIHQETLDTLARSHLKHNPGEMSVYCNDGFTLAEMIVERLSGNKYIEFLNQRIFRPLGLDNTGLSVGEISDKKIALYYDPETGKRHPPEVISVIGAGGLSANPEDLARFADGVLTKDKLLKASLEEMRKVQSPGFWCELKNPGLSWGLGWDFTSLPRYKAEGIQVLGKSGGTSNYSSMLYTAPEKRVSVAVVCSGPGADTMKIALDVFNAVLVENGWISKEEKSVSISPEPRELPKDLMPYAGYYAADGLMLIEFDTPKKTVTVSEVTGRKKEVAKSLIYNNGYLHDNEGYRYYFVSCRGETFFVVNTGTINSDIVWLQKVKPVSRPRKLKIDLNGKRWLQRNVYPFEAVASTETHAVESLLYDDLPGYVFFDGLKIIQSPEFAGMPFNAVRDQSQLRLFDENGRTWAQVSDMLYSPVNNANKLREGENTVKIERDGYNQWLIAEEKMTVSFIKPEKGRVIVISGDGPVYDSAIDSGDVYVAKGDLIELAGYPDYVFKVTGKK